MLDAALKVRKLRVPDPFVVEHEAKVLKGYVDTFVKPSHSECRRACQCLKEFEETEKVEPLLCLYSLETPFYSKVGGPNYCHVLLEPLSRNLDALTDRHFDLEDYEAALREEQDEGRASVITLASFASTTLEEDRARFFAEAHSMADKVTVLVTCHFPKRCDTAIALYEVSPSSKCISNFEDEQEVLLYPGTMFRVTKVDATTDTSLAHIHLTNVVPEFHPGAVALKTARKKALDAVVPSFFR